MYKPKKIKSPKPVEAKPADTATEMFLKEVDEALHEEKLKHFWDTYKIFILGGVAVLLLGSLAIQGFNQYTQNQRIAAAEAYANTPAGELAILQTSTVPGIALLATLNEARTLAEAGDHAAAVALYATLAEDNSLPTNIQYLAAFYASLAEMEVDLNAAQIRLSTGDTAENPFRASVLTYLAEIAELKNENAAALALWQRIELLDNAPTALKTQAEQRAALIEAQLG